MDQSYAQLYARLNEELRDGDDFTFTPLEKNEALTSAIEDEHVFHYIRDNSTVIAAATPSYQIPDGWDSVAELEVDYYGDGVGLPLNSGAWYYLDGAIYIKRSYVYGLPVGKRLIMIGKYKYGVSDTIPRDLVNYVLALGNLNTLAILRNGKTNRFLKTDVTLNELLASYNAYQVKVDRMKKALINRRFLRG